MDKILGTCQYWKHPPITSASTWINLWPRRQRQHVPQNVWTHPLHYMAYKPQTPLLQDCYYRFPEITIQLHMQVPFYVSLQKECIMISHIYPSTFHPSDYRMYSNYIQDEGSVLSNEFSFVSLVWISPIQSYFPRNLSEYQFSQNTYCKVPIILLYKVQMCLKLVYFFETVLLCTVISPPVRDFYLQQLNIHASTSIQKETKSI